MRSRPTSRDRSGFTLIEILVVTGILIAVFSFGALIDLSTVSRENLLSSQATLVSVLQKARSRAMNNIGASPHGVHIEADEYVLFRGTSYSSSSPWNESLDRNDAIAIDTTDIGTDDIVFAQLSGDPSDTGDIVLSDGMNSRIVSVEAAGLINW